MSNNLDDFINAKLGKEIPRRREVKQSARYKLKSDTVYNTVFFFNLNLKRLDYDSLCFSITKDGGRISIQREEADVLVLDKVGKNNHIQICLDEDTFIDTFIEGEIKEVQSETPTISNEPSVIKTPSQTSRIIPLDMTAFKDNSLAGKRIAFIGSFRHFDDYVFQSTINRLGGVVVGPNEFYDWFVCGKDVNPLEYTDSLVKVITENDFIRMIS
jgi:hypothetical protein